MFSSRKAENKATGNNMFGCAASGNKTLAIKVTEVATSQNKEIVDIVASGNKDTAKTNLQVATNRNKETAKELTNQIISQNHNVDQEAIAAFKWASLRMSWNANNVRRSSSSSQ